MCFSSRSLRIQTGVGQSVQRTISASGDSLFVVVIYLLSSCPVLRDYPSVAYINLFRMTGRVHLNPLLAPPDVIPLQPQKPDLTSPPQVRATARYPPKTGNFPIPALERFVRKGADDGDILVDDGLRFSRQPGKDR